MQYVVEKIGPTGLKGVITLQGAKNSMLNNLCVPLLTNEECVISNVPAIADIKLNLDILRSFGAEVRWLDRNSVSVKCDSVHSATFAAAQSVLTTGSKLFIPMMVARFGEYQTGPSRGCRIGDRQFLQYAKSLENFGIGHEVSGEEDYRFFLSGKQVNTYKLPFPSFGVTVNAILAAAALNLEVVMENTCLEPEIDNTIEMINCMGGSISRVGSDIRIQKHAGSLRGCAFRNLSDRNAAVTYTAMALATSGAISIRNFDDVKMDAFYRFLDAIGANYSHHDAILEVAGMSSPPKPVRLSAFLYPEFHSDWQPLVSVLLTLAEGESHVEERLFPNRLEHWTELERMGALVELVRGPLDRFHDNDIHAATIRGPVKLHGAHVTAHNLRAGAALVGAGLIADGQTIILNAEEVERGYEDMPGILRSLGATIREERTSTSESS